MIEPAVQSIIWNVTPYEDVHHTMRYLQQLPNPNVQKCNVSTSKRRHCHRQCRRLRHIQDQPSTPEPLTRAHRWYVVCLLCPIIVSSLLTCWCSCCPQLFNGTRRPKTDPVFDALGHQDELNVLLGISREFSDKNSDISEMYYSYRLLSQAINIAITYRLTEIQSRIFDLGAATATPIDSSTENRIAYTSVVSYCTAFVVLSKYHEIFILFCSSHLPILIG